MFWRPHKGGARSSKAAQFKSFCINSLGAQTRSMRWRPCKDRTRSPKAVRLRCDIFFLGDFLKVKSRGVLEIFFHVVSEPTSSQWTPFFILRIGACVCIHTGLYERPLPRSRFSCQCKTCKRRSFTQSLRVPLWIAAYRSQWNWKK